MKSLWFQNRNGQTCEIVESLCPKVCKHFVGLASGPRGYAFCEAFCTAGWKLLQCIKMFDGTGARKVNQEFFFWLQSTTSVTNSFNTLLEYHGNQLQAIN